MTNKQIFPCVRCKSKLRIPVDKGIIIFTCPVCKRILRYMPQTTGNSPAQIKNPVTKPAVTAKPPVTKPAVTAKPPVTKPAVTAKPPVTKPAVTAKPPVTKSATQVPKPAIKAPTRTVWITRLLHAHKGFDYQGIMNKIQDNVNVDIYLDGVKVGTLSGQSNLKDVELKIDSNEHVLRVGIIGKQFKLPAGNDNYLVSFFNGGFLVGIDDDPFLEGLCSFIRKMVRGQGFKDRIYDPNNANQTVDIRIHEKGINIVYRVKEPKGFFQHLTLENEEKISYAGIGVTPLPKSRQPDGYWSYVDMIVRDVITLDEQADLTWNGGGYTPRKIHSLY